MLALFSTVSGWQLSTAGLRRPSPALSPRLSPIMAAGSWRSAEEGQAAFQEWMEGSCPPGAVPRNYSTAAGAGVQTMEGALAAVWHAVCLSLDQTASRPSLSVVLLPLVTSVRAEAGIVALQRPLQQCRDCCAGFGKRLLLQTLHPTDDAGRASPVPALMLSSRVGPPLRLEGEGTERNAEEVEEARQSLERLILVDRAKDSEEADAAPVIAAAVDWFSESFATIHRLVRCPPAPPP